MSVLDAIARPVLPALPPDIRSSAILETAPQTVAQTADVPTASADPIVPPPIPVDALASAPGSQGPAPAPPAPVADPVPAPAVDEPEAPMDFGGMFPPTGEEMAAQMEAEQREAQARKAAAAEELDADMKSRLKNRKKKAKEQKANKPDLRPPGISPVVKQAFNVIAVLAVIGLLFVGYLFFQRVQAATRVTELEVGQCVDDFFSEAQGEFRNVFVVDTLGCEQPHAYEVMAVSTTVFDEAEVADGYPGIDRTFAIGQEFCLDEYDTFVGGDFTTSPWQVWTFVPTEVRWDSGDRKVQCLVGDAAEVNLVEGSLQGAGE